MATQLQIRRGTASQIAAFTGAEGEVVVNTTNDSVHVNDGSTAGGFELARADLNNVSDASLNAALTGNTVSALTITTLTLGSTAITATGAEINILDGVTATAAELNILDGVTSTTAELNILDGVTSTAAELNILDGVTATTAELNYVDGVTSAIQTQIDAKAPLASPTFTGRAVVDGLTSSASIVGTSNSNSLGGTNFTSNVGIGGASGGAILQLNNSSASYLDIKSDNVLRTRIYNDSAQTILESTTSNLIFKSDSTERMRISGGNLLVGKTSTSIGDAGHTIFASGEVFHTVAGTPLYVNRTGSDGSIQNFYKDGTAVGSIDTHSGAIQFGQGNVNLAFENATDQVYPVNDSGTNNDGDIDLGKSNSRFKDIYLSGGVNFSANAHAPGMTSETLSDYEEGTCSLTWSGSGGTANFTNTAFNYVKVGNMVSINGRTLSSLPNITGTLELTGLPFTSVGDASGSILYRHLTPPSGAHTLICFLGGGSARFQPFWAAAGTYVQLNSSHINVNNAQDMYLSINYRTS